MSNESGKSTDEGGEFVAGGGKGNVRHKMELLAKHAESNIALLNTIRKLRKQFQEENERFDAKVRDLVDRGMIARNTCYLTSRGVVVVMASDQTDLGMTVSLLPLSDNCMHAAPEG